MPGIVIQLQMDCVNPQTSTTDLLRKALLVARKLKIKNAEEWILLEMNGYGAENDVPKYRMVRGQLRGQDPYTGHYYPIIFKSEREMEIVSSKANGQSIGEIESTIANAGPDDSFQTGIPHEFAVKWMRQFNLSGLPFLHVQKSELTKIVSSVRNKIVEWASDLESQGIIGDEFTFSEKEKAAAGSVVFNIGSMVNSQIQQDAANSTQVQKNFRVEKAEVQRLVEKIKEEVRSGNFPSEMKSQLEIDLATIESQLRAPKPNNSILTEGFLSIQRIFEGAVGGAIGTALATQAAKMAPFLFQ